MNSNKALQVPYGTRDVLPGEAGARRALENDVAAVFKAWGYDEVKTPAFEYYDTFAVAGQKSDTDFKFFDRLNNILVLRSDMTTPLARMVAMRLKGDGVKRLFYLANLFRYEDSQAGRQCEFSQAGVEMMGAAGPCADAEMLALAVASVQAAGLSDFTVSLGHIEFINGLIEAAGFDAGQAQSIKECLIRHDVVGLCSLVEATDMSNEHKELFKRLPFMHGGSELLDKLNAAGLNERSQNALRDLRDIYQLAEAYGIASCLRFDLSLLRSLDYYTGMIFEGYTADIGFPIFGGGRYDNMMQNFGKVCPATGFAIGIERVMLVLERRKALVTASRWDVLVAFAPGKTQEAIAESLRLRKAGRSVKMAVGPMSFEEARSAQLQSGCDSLLYI